MPPATDSQCSGHLQFAMRTDVGRVRSGNQDFYAATAETGLFVVCDGMGGAAAGEVASELAATTFLRVMGVAEDSTEWGDRETRLREAVIAANAAILGKARIIKNMRGMGTTLVALQYVPNGAGCDGDVVIAHVGDSRCYRLRGEELVLLTEDHSLVQEQLRSGELTAEQAERSPLRNVITRAVGSAPEIKPEITRQRAASGDCYLLASDGLTRELKDEAIQRYLRERLEAPLEKLCAGLVEAANDAGGHDNVTVLLVRIT